jgi:molybdenum cofactor cytidylyltransferase
MRYVTVPIGSALGGILVHSIAVERQTLRKGQVLTAEAIAAIGAAGSETVTVVFLDDGDVDEDLAALRVAEALTGDGIEREAANTGRVNLVAGRTGLLTYREADIDAANRIDEAMTVAIRPSDEWVVAGQMVATVKTIPYAVSRTILAAVVERAREAQITVAAARPLRAGLVQTAFAATPPRLHDKMGEVTAARINHLGGRLVSDRRCAHSEDALAREIAAEAAEGRDLILIAGASSVADRMDVVPAALETAGGKVHRLGMPVDPGNLLVYGTIGGRPVIGVPGCARSAKPNGFDWILRRVFSGLPVTSELIAAMGVGGLLKEIPERPLPRRKIKPASPRIAAVVLAAGLSSRMGDCNKLLCEIDSTPMVRRVVETLIDAAVGEVIVVTGHDAPAVVAAVAGLDLGLAHNANYRSGLSSSLAKGLAAVPETADGALICLGDMPLVAADTIRRIVEEFAPSLGKEICAPVRHGRRGHPVLFGRSLFKDLQALSGDVGGRKLFDAFPTRVIEVIVDDEGILTDFDTGEDFDRTVG